MPPPTTGSTHTDEPPKSRRLPKQNGRNLLFWLDFARYDLGRLILVDDVEACVGLECLGDADALGGLVVLE